MTKKTIIVVIGSLKVQLWGHTEWSACVHSAYAQTYLRLTWSDGQYNQGSKVIPQRQKSHRVQCIFMFTKTKIIIKINVYIFITFTSFESWTIYVIYIVILIGFSLCKLERQRIKFCIRDFGHDVNIDVNGSLPFLKFPLNLNCCIWDDRYKMFISHILGMHNFPFKSLQNVSIFFTMIHNIKCHVNIKMH